jgi:tellurite resistance-related uncharacterized protein
MREMWEAAEALARLGLWVRINSRKGTLTVYRSDDEGQVTRIGKLRFPVENILGG